MKDDKDIFSLFMEILNQSDISKDDIRRSLEYAINNKLNKEDVRRSLAYARDLEQGLSKPDPAIYQRMLDALKLSPEECLYVGDGGSRELYAARDIGMQTLQCTWFHELAFEPHIPCPLLDDFPHADRQEEVLNYLSSFTM